MEELSAMESEKSSHIRGSQQPQTTSSTRKMVGAPLGNVPKNRSSSHRPDLVGARYGSVEIVDPHVMWLGKKGNRKLHVICECVTCFNRSVISFHNLTGAKTKGCRNCNQPDPVYPDWLYSRVQAMRARCCNPKNGQYQRYGGRGIEFRFPGVKAGTIWIMNNLGIPEFETKLDRGYVQLDRIDTNGHYEPGNLRWASIKLNQCNKRGPKSVAHMHRFRMKNPEIRYSDSTLQKFFAIGMTDDQIIERFHKPSLKPKGKYGTYSTPDPTIASLVKGC